MNIALVRKEFLEQHGGAERFAVGLACGLAECGHQVQVYAGRAERSGPVGVGITRVPFISRPSALKNLSFCRSVRQMVSRQAHDIVNGLSQIYPQDVYRVGDGLHRHWLRMRGPGARLAACLSPRHQVILMIERRIFTPGNYVQIIANSQLCRQQVQHYYGVPASAVQVVRNGVDLERFSPPSGARRAAARASWGLQPQECALLFAGNNFRRKGLRCVLECAARLRDLGHPVRVLVAGRGRSGPYQTLARALGISALVHWVGHVTDMTSLFAAADALVHPARYDPFSNVCLEAMASGVPIVTTVHNGAAELIRPGASGLVYADPEDAAAMAAGLCAALEAGRAGLPVFGAAARKAAEACTWERTITETLAIYRAAVRHKGVFHG